MVKGRTRKEGKIKEEIKGERERTASWQEYRGTARQVRGARNLCGRAGERPYTQFSSVYCIRYNLIPRQNPHIIIAVLLY